MNEMQQAEERSATIANRKESPVAGTSVAIVGAGIGGLAAAIRLARAGLHVQVIEKNHKPGGRCGSYEHGGYKFDLGPTILLVPSVLEELFGHAGRSLENYLRLRRIAPNYTIHYPDQSHFTLWGDDARMKSELERIEPGSFEKYQRFISVGEAQMDEAMSRFAVTHYPSLRSFANVSVLRGLLRARAYRSVASHVANYFTDERLRMAFSFQTMYLGLSPYEAPAIYGLLPYTELRDGIWYPEGGLYEVPLAMERLAKELGVSFHYGEEVTSVEQAANGSVRALRTKRGSVFRSDVVLFNADLPWVYRSFFPATKQAKQLQTAKYTSSGFMLYLGVRKKFPALQHHNVFFSPGFRESFSSLFDELVLPKEVNFYVANPSASDPTVAPEGASALYVLVPVPRENPKIDWNRAGPRLREAVLDRLEKTVAPGLRAAIEVEHTLDPRSWASSFHLEHGAAFGLSLTLDQVGPLRPKNHDPALPNVYFCGASTQPGTGIPLVAISGRLAAERILSEACYPRAHDSAT